jgi:AGZA family xanthine/uracil permease-like MFS transporter
MIKKVNGSLLIGIIAVTILGFVFGVTPLPDRFVDLPPDISPILFELDISGAFTWGMFAVILTVFVMDFVDTMGTLIGVSFKAELLDEDGNLPEIEKPMLCDSLATIVGSLCGTTTTGTYIESAAGIEAGGKSGFTSVVTALLFLLTLFFAPFITAIPTYAYGSSLIVVGLLMLQPVTKFKFEDLSEIIPAFATITLMSFTYNLGIGMTAGFVLYPLSKVFAGKYKEVHPGMWVMFILSVLFYIFYPY